MEPFMRKSARPSIAFIVCLAVAPALVASFASAQARVGMISPLSGPRASIGKDAVDGARLAIKKLDTERGGSRCAIELEIEDSKGGPADGIGAFEKLKASGVQMVITQNSGVSLPVSPIANRAGVLQLAISTTSDAYASRDDLTFRTNGGTRYEAVALAAYAEKTMREEHSSIAVFRMEDEYPESLHKNLMPELGKRGIETCIDDAFLPGETDFRGVVTRIRRYKPSLIMCLGYQMECGRLLRQTREAGERGSPFVGVTPVNNREFFEAAGESAEGAAVSYIGVDPDNPAAREFMSVYGRAPNVFSANAYDAVLLLHQALMSCGCRDEPACLKKGLFAIKEFRGMSGDKGFDDEFGDMDDHYVILVARNGVFVEEKREGAGIQSW